MKCLKCGKDGTEHTFLCLEISRISTEKYVEEIATGTGFHAVCSDCVKIPLPRFFGEFFRKPAPSPVRSLIYWSQQNEPEKNGSAFESFRLLPIVKEEWEKIATEGKQDRRWSMFEKSLRLLDVSMTFKNMIFSEIFETGKWRDLADHQVIRIVLHTDLIS